MSNIIRRPGPPDADRPRLGSEGQVYVTLAAAEAFAASTRQRIEEARRDLTEILLDARQSATDTSRYRARSRTTQLDVDATISREGRLLVVVHVHVREHLR